MNMRAPDVIQPVTADFEELKALESALSRVPVHTTFCLSSPDTEPLNIPESLFRALKEAAHILLQDSAVVISPLHRRLSTTEAGDILGVSRQYLTRLIDRGEIPCDRTGRHRKIKLSDLLEFKRKRDQARGAFLDAFTADLASEGYYD
jgi:excisionase family DNA binding protein